MVTQDEIDHVLRLAEDELEHLKRDGEYDDECRADYLYSTRVFKRVRKYLTTEGRIKP